MAHTTMLITTLLIAQTLCAPQNISGINIVKTPVNMSLEELNYIVKVRSGQEEAKPKVLTPCARAILGCCQGKTMNVNCSEGLSCGALFFDVNPCEDRFVDDALKAARSFYEQLNKVST